MQIELTTVQRVAITGTLNRIGTDDGQGNRTFDVLTARFRRRVRQAFELSEIEELADAGNIYVQVCGASEEDIQTPEGRTEAVKRGRSVVRLFDCSKGDLEWLKGQLETTETHRLIADDVVDCIDHIELTLAQAVVAAQPKPDNGVEVHA